MNFNNPVPPSLSALRQVATRCFPPLNANASFTRGMARSFHIARDALVSPTAVYANWRMNNAGELDGLGAGTLDVALEYPAGTFTRANECIAAGNGPVAFPLGNTALTFNVTVPKGASFFLRSMQRCASGILWTQVAGGSNYGAAPGDFMDIGTADSIDKVMGGTIGPSNGICFFPIVIAAPSSSESVLICGTSREAGGVSGVTDAACDLGLTARVVGPMMGYTSFGMAGTLLAGWNSGSHTYLNQLLAAGYWTRVVNEFGINDIPNDTASALVARRTAFASAVKAQRPTIRIIGHTLYPYVPSTDVYVTKANQTMATNQPKLLVFNNLVRAGIAGEDGVWDEADYLDPYREGKYPVSRNPNDTARTPTSLTGGISGTTLTVSAIASGSLSVGDPLYDTSGLINDSTWIMEQLTGTAGSTGTYRVSKGHSGFPLKAVVPAGTAMTTAGFTTRDGLHAQWFGEEMIVRNGGPALLAVLR